ncbi:MAG TPA: hypothetical protein VGV67_08275 [Solirubrobacteraceae bacterium]|nr:hypothetical protein [Solirubrobacteraceae bacterium]
MKNIHLIAAAATAIALIALAAAEPAVAASDLGRNLGNEIKTWATALLLGVAALVAIPVLARRDVTAASSSLSWCSSSAASLSPRAR